MPNPENPSHARARERVAMECRLRGWTLEKIAEEIGRRGLGKVSAVAVHKMLRRVDQRADAAMIDEVAESRRRQLLALRHFQQEMADAWHRSKEDAQRVKERTVEADDPSPAPNVNGATPATLRRLKPTKTTEMEVKGQVGERGYVETALKALADERKILGYDAPVRSDVTTDGQAFGPPAIGWVINHAVRRAEPEDEDDDDAGESAG
jgi:lysozyme family protein